MKLKLLEGTVSLFEKLIDRDHLNNAFKYVKKNRGSPGVDQVSIEDFERNKDKELSQLIKDLSNWTYKPRPVKRVQIPKPGTVEMRKLGIPCVRDRVVQTAIKLFLEPHFETIFSENSYGFRPGRSQHDAIRAAQGFVTQGNKFCVDIDLAKFFDTVNQDRLMTGLSQVIADKRIIRLIGLTLESGVIEAGLFHETLEGTTQGSPLSPLLSNFVLNELDRELERLGLSFCRYADDCNIFVASEEAAERIMRTVTQFIERRLKLKVNRDKSRTARVEEVKFLGFTLTQHGYVSVSKQSMRRSMSKVVELSRRGTSENFKTSLNRFNSWYQGWSNYYGLATINNFRALEAHYRRRMRARFISQQKSRRNLYKHFLAKGLTHSIARTAYTKHKKWRLSKTIAASKAYPNQWFDDQGMYLASVKYNRLTGEI